MIYTSYFAKEAKLNRPNTIYVSIAVGNPKFELPFTLYQLNEIKPYGVFGKYHGEEYYNHYIQRLEKIGVSDIFKKLCAIQQNNPDCDLILMCYEKNPNECHRRMFADWWLHKTGEIINEID